MADMTVAEAKRRLKACGWRLGRMKRQEIGTLTGWMDGWIVDAWDADGASPPQYAKGRTRSDALADLVERIEAMEEKR